MTEHRSGFIAIVGRPNAGKSTLTNALVGQKVAITSSKPQTTRRVIRGIINQPDAQIVLVDTPGIHRPRNTLGERLNALVEQQWGEVDAIALCLPADEAIGPGDRWIAHRLADATRGGRRTPVIALVTKTDRIARPQLAPKLTSVAELGTEHRGRLGRHRAGLGHGGGPARRRRRGVHRGAARGSVDVPRR